MKKILEVLLYGDNDLRFNTDLDRSDLRDFIPTLASTAAITMVTKLWGGKEPYVLAAIRALSIADLAVSVNRKEMIRQLDECSEMLVRSFQEAKAQLEKNGGKVITFAPGVNPPKMPS